MIYDIFIAGLLLMGAWLLWPLAIAFAIFIFFAMLYGGALFLGWVMNWRIFNKKWWKNVFN
jgi:hypothetical protein